MALINEYANCIVFGSVGAAIIIIGSAAARLARRTAAKPPMPARDPIHLGDALGTVTWDLNKSWASNAAGIGAVLGGLLTAFAIPDSAVGSFGKQTYVSLNVFFVALVAAAPFVYMGWQAVVPERPNAPAPVALHGFVGMFLFAGVFTAWAVLGQIATLFVMVIEIGNLKTPTGTVWSPLVVVFFALFLILILVMLMPYLHQSAFANVVNGVPRDPPPSPPPPRVDVHVHVHLTGAEQEGGTRAFALGPVDVTAEPAAVTAAPSDVTAAPADLTAAPRGPSPVSLL